MTTVTPELTVADRVAVEAGCYYDPAAGERPVTFIERFCRQSQGRWAGQPLILEGWQKDFLRRLFGWKRPGGLRRFRRAYLEVGKKNGKSTLLSAIVILLLIADKHGDAVEGRPEIVLNAVDRDQASIIYKEAALMIESSPELKRRLQVIRSTKTILDPKTQGVIVANSADAPKHDGKNTSAVIFDELHRQKNRDLWEMFEYSGRAREQPLTISITTAGDDEHGVWYEQRDYSEKVNRGEIPDTTHLGVVYRADDGDNIDDEATWVKANPSLGRTLSFEDFARDLTEAKQTPAKLALFKRLRLNIISNTESRFLSPESWAACNSEPIDPELFRGRPCWMGYDGAENTDLAALVTIFGDDEAGYDLLCRFWMAADRVPFLERNDRVPYRLWIDRGFIEAVPGDLIGKASIRREILSQSARFDVRRLGIDPWKAREFGVDLMNNDGLDVMEIRQGYASLSAPTAKLEAMVVGKQLRHGNNPVLRWMAGNAVAKKDENANIRLDKGKSRQRIDGMSALVNAIAMMVADDGAESDESPLFYVGSRRAP